MPPLRVLHVIPSLSPRDGGPTRAIGIMERGLSAAGVEVTTLTTDHGLGPARAGVTENGARRIHAHTWLIPYKVAPGLVPHLLQAVKQHDVVHIHALFSFAATAAAWAAARQGVPYVVRPLGTLSGYGLNARRPRLKQLSMALIERRILRAAAAVHFTSRAELAEAEALGLPLRAVVIPLGVDADAGGPAAPFSHAALAGRRVILFLSRLDPKKNVEALIDAVAGSPTLRSTAALLIAGDGDGRYVAGLKARAAAAGVADHTVWLGHIEGAEKQAALAAADAFVLPSFSENFGIAAVEALAAGLPCVLGRGVAIAHEVADAGAGVAVAPEPAAIAGALEGVLGGDPSVAHDMAQRARYLAAQRFTSHAMAKRLIALYEDIRKPARRAEMATAES
ncbi:MAG TPA: glycosyltransferase [Hyphomicrobiaceae bacterium]|nr:glycosyltransferase [Hyphomicrobiaceae bacterium]